MLTDVGFDIVKKKRKGERTSERREEEGKCS
jgi:hypothetical protein